MISLLARIRYVLMGSDSKIASNERRIAQLEDEYLRKVEAGCQPATGKAYDMDALRHALERRR